MKSLSDEDKEELENKFRAVEGGLDNSLLTTYRHLARAGAEGEVAWMDMGLPTAGERGSLARRVREYLKSQDVLLERLGPRPLLEKALGKGEGEKPLEELYEAFLRYPHLPLLEGEGVLRRAVMQGVRDGVFGVRVGDRVYLGEPVGEAELEYGATLLRREVAEGLKGQARPAPGSLPPAGGAEVVASRVGEAGPGGGAATAMAGRAGGVRSLRLRVKVPWDKLSDFVRGVVMPLRADGARLEVEVVVQAHAESGDIKQSTLDQKVKETLNQIGAEVLEDHQE